MSFKPSQGWLISIAVQRGNADILIRDEQRGRARTDWWIVGGGKRRHRHRRHLTSPLYSVSDVPWLRNGGHGDDSDHIDQHSQLLSEGAPPSIIPDSLSPPASASPSLLSSVVSSPCGTREG